MGLIELAERPTAALPRPLTHARLPLMAILLGAVATTVSALGSWIPSLWGDEVTSVLSAERSLPSLLRMLDNVDAVHGTYYFLMHFWVEAFGSSPFSMRFPSALAVGIMVAGVVMLGSRLAGRRTGLIAGGIAVLLPRVTYMGEEARGYAMSAACVVWVTFLLVHIIQSRAAGRSIRRRVWALYAFGVALTAYIFLFSVLIVVSHLVMVLLVRQRGLVRRWGVAVGTGIVLALPVIIFGVNERGQIAFLAERDTTSFTSLAVNQWFGNGATATVAWGIIVAAAVLGTLRWRGARVRDRSAASIRVHDARPPHLIPLSFVWLVGSSGMLLLANTIHPLYSGRYLSFAIPAAALIIGWFISQIRIVWIAAVLAVAVLATSSISWASERTPYAKNGSDWAEVAATMTSEARPGDVVLFDEGSRPSQRPRLGMRAYPAAYRGLKDIALKSYWWQTANWYDATYPLSDVTDRLEGADTVWLLEHRTAGGSADTWDLATLESLGWVVSTTFQEHSSVILKLTRG